MSKEWKAGDVAAVTMTHFDGRQVTYSPCMWDAENDGWVSGYSGALYPSEGVWQVTKVRPFVVLDPEFSGDVARVENALEAHGCRVSTNVQTALRSLIAPPRPEEPTGLGAVVEDEEGVRWVRTHATGYPWHANLDPSDRNCTAVRKYADLTPVRVLSEGVTP